MSLDDYIRRLSTTIIHELQGPIEESLRGLLAEVMAAAQRDREEAVAALQTQLATLRQDHEAAQARIEAEREGLLEQHAAALTLLREEVTAEVGQAVLEEARQMAQAEQAGAEAALRVLLAAEREASEEALRTELRREREAAEDALRSELLREQDAMEQALRDELRNEYEARARLLEETHQQALGALRDEVTAEVGQAVLCEALDMARSEHAAAEEAHQQALAALRDEVTAEVGQAVLSEALDMARSERAAAEEAHKQELAALRETVREEVTAEFGQAVMAEALQVARDEQVVAEHALRAHLLAEHDAAQQALRAELVAGQEAPDASSLARALRQLDEAGSLTDALGRLLAQVSAHAPAAIFLVGADSIRSWRVAGCDAPEGWDLELPLNEAGPLGRAVQTAALITVSKDELAGSPLPGWLLPGDAEAAFAAPVSVGGRVVALMYVAAGGRSAELEILASHAGRCLEVLTFARLSANARPFPVHQTGTDVRRSTSTEATSDATREEESARRYARLLLSEVKLYNESAVEEGCARRDLLARLGPEIERARRLYEDKIPALAGDRASWFDEELVRTLAGGDASMLGQVT